MQVTAQPIENITNNPNKAGSISITYFTDPLCCWSWAFEPEWRRLQFEFKGLIAWNYCMGGLIPAWNNFSDPVNSVTRAVQMGPVWMQASQLSGMHMESTIWMKDPPASSYPACIAVKCAQLQSEEFGEQYLRLLREAVMLQGINIAHYEVLINLSEVLSKKFEGFDVDIFKQQLSGKEGLEAFKADMQQVKNYNITRFPTLLLRSDQQAIMFTGYRPYSALLDALHQLQPGLKTLYKATSKEEYQSKWLSITDREIEEALK